MVQIKRNNKKKIGKTARLLQGLHEYKSENNRRTTKRISTTSEKKLKQSQKPSKPLLHTKKIKLLDKCGRRIKIKGMCVYCYRKHYYQQNKEVILQKHKEYRNKNIEAERKKSLNYYYKNQKRLLKKMRKYRNENKEKIRMMQRHYHSQNKEVNKIKRNMWKTLSPQELIKKVMKK